MKIEKTVVTAKPMQLKGTWTIETGSYYAPYIPSNMLPMTWQQYLSELQGKFATWTLTLPKLSMDKKLEQVNEVMQERFPGPYTVEEFYNAKLQRFDLRLKFDDPKQEMLWKIKW